MHMKATNDQKLQTAILQQNFIKLVENLTRLSPPQSQSVHQISRLQLKYFLRYLANENFNVILLKGQ